MRDEISRYNDEDFTLKIIEIIIMPLIVLCGYPASGKTSLCSQLQKYFEEQGIKVCVVSENNLVGNQKNETYSGKQRTINIL